MGSKPNIRSRMGWTSKVPQQVVEGTKSHEGTHPIGDCITSSGYFMASVNIKDAYINIPIL